MRRSEPPTPSERRTSTMRNLAALFLLCSCGMLGPNSEQRQQLYFHQSNAKLYYESRHFDQALDQIQRGLAIEPDDYQLHLVKSMTLLRVAQERNDPAKLREAERSFDHLMTLRKVDKLEPQALLGYALMQQRLGLEQSTEAERIREELKRTAWSELERTQREAKANEHEQKAQSFMNIAERQLADLLKRGDLPDLAEYHLLQILSLQGRLAEAIEHGHAYLKHSAKNQALHHTNIERTPSVAYESFQRKELQDLINQEIEVRALLANLHFKLGQHAEVVAELDRVLALDPTRSIDYFNRGRSLKALGKTELMRRDYQKFVATTKLPPGSAQVTDACAELSGR